MRLLEREQGLDTVRRALDGMGADGTVLTAVTGTPGTGRSAFLDAVAAHAEQAGCVVRRARGSRLARGLSLGDPAAPLPDPTVRPLVLLVDDLQWAGEHALAALSALLDDPGQGRLFLVAAVCEGEFATETSGVQDVLHRADHVVRTGPLGPEGVGALLGGHGHVLSDGQVRAWHRATEGNPALVASLLERLDHAERPARARLLDLARARPAPWRLRSRVAAALTGHPDSVGRLAACAALLGGRAQTHVLARLAELDPGEADRAAGALASLGWAADRWTPPVLWDCVREAAEEGVGLTDRVRLHRRAAELLYVAGEPAERVVRHVMEVGPGDWTGAAGLLRDTACELWRLGDDALAVRGLRRALREFPPDSPRRGDLLTALADVEREADTSAMLRHVGQALPLLGTVEERAAVVSCVPLTLFLSAPHAVPELLEPAGAGHARRIPAAAGTGVGAGEQAPAAAGKGAGTAAATAPGTPRARHLGPRLEARVRLAGPGDPAAHDEAAERLRSLAPDPDAGPDEAALRELTAVLVFAGTHSGRLRSDEVARRTRWLLEHEPASAVSRYAACALTIACAAVAETGEPADCWLDMALETARGRGDRRLRTAVLSWRALTALHAGRSADARADARRACAASRDPGQDPSVDALEDHDWLSVLGLTSVAVETGDAWLAERLRDRLVQGPGAGQPVCRLALRVLRIPLTPERELPVVLADLQDAARRAEAAGWCNPVLFPVDLWCVPLLLRLGDPEAALRLLADACDRARRFGAPGALGRILRMWGTVVRGRYALSLLSESVAVLRTSRNQLELGRSLTAYGNRMRAAGRPGADEVLAEADRIAEATGEAVLGRWTEVRQPLPPGAPVACGNLSDTEWRVASLVALGHTNQDAADALGVTRRAVEKILTRLYQRLEVDGRSGLVPAVRRMAGRAAFGTGVLADRL
ncbi:LuxR C-terminal-related transcriptional regulator [Streptomyces coelicoflavus]|uniref:LuxR C-terminal-related transcriptional regulator n=1 Tax=Streptomyces coelicoflavus TaxID=285562 RepID=UPI000D5A20CF|nr:LuxR C-terminal-related transcriptional regulator [Streptomyces coelicoflavus]